MTARNRPIALDILGDKVYNIQSWVDNNNKEKQAAEWSSWEPQYPRPTFKGRSTIPHNNRKRVPIPPRGSTQQTKPPPPRGNRQRNSPPPHGNRQRNPQPPRGNRQSVPVSTKPQATGGAPDHQNFTAPKDSSRSRPYAGRNRRQNQRIRAESRKDGHDSSDWLLDANNQAAVGNQVEAQTSNNIDLDNHPNNSLPTPGASNLRQLHDAFVSTSPQENPMQDDSRKTDPQPHSMAQASPKSDYVPPHLRNRQSTSPPADTRDSAPNARSEYVPPHLRNRKSASPPRDPEDSATQPKQDHVPPHKRKGRRRGQRNQNASNAKSAGQLNEQTASEAKAPFENGAEHNGENGDLMEVYRRPVVEVPKDVWTIKPGKKMPIPQSPKKKGRRGKAFATNKEIREAYENAPSVNGSEWAKDEGWDKVFGPDEDDPNYDAYRLVDWEGNFLPCVDWTYREAFSVDPAKQKEYIQTWILRGPQPGDESAVPINGGDSEIATTSWAALKIDGLPLQEWWQEAMDCHHFEDDCVPWWTTFMPGTSQLAPHNAPDCHVDEKDKEHDHEAYEKDEGAGPKCKQFIAREKRKAEQKRRRRQELDEQAAAIRAELPSVYAQLPKIHTKINFYVRFAAPSDMLQITAIYNKILQSSVKIAERDAVTKETMMGRLNESKRDSFSWVVAVARARNNRGVEYDHVFGFASATDYHSIGGMYRYTADIEVFVDPEFQRKGIGSCLMDRLMKLLTTDYDGYEGYEFYGDGTGLAERGGGRRLNAIVMNVPHDSGDPKDLEAASKFLSQFDMKQAGNLPGVGIKLKKTVDLAIFHAKVTPEIDPKKELGL
ncbi:hypothetical protein HDK77DRAFT_427144 [Phyllosticta capitalensis]